MSEFGALNLEEMTGENNRLAEQGGAVGFLDQFVPMPEVKPGQTGSVAVRILPPVKGGKLFQYNRVHTMNGRKVHCPRPVVNGKWDRNVACPVCDYYSGLWRQIDKLEKQFGKDCPQCQPLKDEARELKPVERYYYNAVVRSMVVDGKEVKNEGPRILSVGKILHGTIIGAIVGREGDADSKLGNITDLKNGWDFIIRKEVTAGSEGFPKYDKSGFARNQSPSGSPEEIKKWQENLHDLTKLRNPKDNDYLEKELAIHRGLIPDITEAFDVDGFDAKWGGKAANKVDEEMEAYTPPPTKQTAAVTEEKVSSVKVQKVAKQEETMAVKDEQFLKELESMEG